MPREAVGEPGLSMSGCVRRSTRQHGSPPPRRPIPASRSWCWEATALDLRPLIDGRRLPPPPRRGPTLTGGGRTSRREELIGPRPSRERIGCRDADRGAVGSSGSSWRVVESGDEGPDRAAGVASGSVVGSGAEVDDSAQQFVGGCVDLDLTGSPRRVEECRAHRQERSMKEACNASKRTRSVCSAPVPTSIAVDRGVCARCVHRATCPLRRNLQAPTRTRVRRRGADVIHGSRARRTVRGGLRASFVARGWRSAVVGGGP